MFWIFLRFKKKLQKLLEFFLSLRFFRCNSRIFSSVFKFFLKLLEFLTSFWNIFQVKNFFSKCLHQFERFQIVAKASRCVCRLQIFLLKLYIMILPTVLFPTSNRPFFAHLIVLWRIRPFTIYPLFDDPLNGPFPRIIPPSHTVHQTPPWQNRHRKRTSWSTQKGFFELAKGNKWDGVSFGARKEPAFCTRALSICRGPLGIGNGMKTGRMQANCGSERVKSEKTWGSRKENVFSANGIIGEIWNA